MSDNGQIRLPVCFHVDDSKLPAVIEEAKRIDEYNNGASQVTYTEEQALTIVFHEDGLETLTRLRYVRGWTVEKDLNWKLLEAPADEDEL